MRGMLLVAAAFVSPACHRPPQPAVAVFSLPAVDAERAARPTPPGFERWSLALASVRYAPVPGVVDASTTQTFGGTVLRCAVTDGELEVTLEDHQGPPWYEEAPAELACRVGPYLVEGSVRRAERRGPRRPRANAGASGSRGRRRGVLSDQGGAHGRTRSPPSRTPRAP